MKFIIINLSLLISFAHTGEVFNNISGSMLPTIFPDQKLDVSYLNPPTVACINCENSIKRGDLWAYANPKKPTEIFVKRVVGLPGDKIKVKAGVLTLNGKTLTKKASKDQKLFDKIKDDLLPQGKAQCSLYQESVDQMSYQVILCAKKVNIDFEGIVPADKVFVLGDNRDNSLDSRIVGPISFSFLKGKANLTRQ